jgi:cysteine-S-conjugate beta-lyase
VGMNLACRAIGGEGDSALTFTPVYPPFFTSSPNSDRRLHRLPLLTDASGQARMDFQALENLVDPAQRIVLLCSPHNPVGRVWPRSELERLAALAIKRGWIIVSDEIHAELVLDGEHVSTGSLSPEIAQRTITLVAPSKTFNVPGLTCAVAVIPDAELRRKFVAAKRGLVGDYNVLGMIAAHAAWTRGEPWRQALLAYLRSNRDHLRRRIESEAPSLKMGPMEATYLAWIDARALQIENPAAFFEKHGLGMNEGSGFGAPGFVRLNFGCPRVTLDRGIDRLVAGVRAALRGRQTQGD